MRHAQEAEEGSRLRAAARRSAAEGKGNIFGREPVFFRGMSGAAPTDHQRLALARAITGDDSKEGIEFMYKLIQKITRRRTGYTGGVYTGMNAVKILSPRSLASVYRTPGPGRRKVF